MSLVFQVKPCFCYLIPYQFAPLVARLKDIERMQGSSTIGFVQRAALYLVSGLRKATHIH
jgi:hypothetical protein